MGSRSYTFNILHKDLHKKLHKEPLLPMSLILFAVILAYSFRLIGRGSFYPTLFSYLRSFIYIRALCRLGNFNPPTYRAETGRTISGRRFGAFDFVVYLSLSKILYILQPVAIRYQWYLFYLPMLFVPRLALLSQCLWASP